MKLWLFAPFFHSLLEWGTYKTLQHVISLQQYKKWHAAMFCMFPDSKSEWKKGATGQSFIWKEITTYRIATLTLVYPFFSKKDKIFENASLC